MHTRRGRTLTELVESIRGLKKKVGCGGTLSNSMQQARATVSMSKTVCAKILADKKKAQKKKNKQNERRYLVEAHLAASTMPFWVVKKWPETALKMT